MTGHGFLTEPGTNRPVHGHSAMIGAVNEDDLGEAFFLMPARWRRPGVLAPVFQLRCIAI